MPYTSATPDQSFRHRVPHATPEQAAQAIVRGWAQGAFEIHFPKRFTLWLKALRILPNRLFFQLVRRIAL